jgi:hypothetical protein
MNCQNCSAEVPEGSQFCLKCGSPLASASAVQPKASRSGLIGLIAVLLGILVVLVVIRIVQNASTPESTIPTKTPRVQAAGPQPHFINLTNGAATVNAGGYVWYTFTVPENSSLVAVGGHFSATGGQGNDIDCYILDEDGMVNFKNGHPTGTYYNSGKVTQAKIGAANLAPGTYYIVLDNRFSLITPKAVQIQATLSYSQ